MQTRHVGGMSEPSVCVMYPSPVFQLQCTTTGASLQWYSHSICAGCMWHARNELLLSLLALQAASNWSVTQQLYVAAVQGK